MSAQADTVALSPRPGRRLRLASPAIGGALATAYLSLVVLLPLAAVVAESTTGGPSAFWQSVTSAQAFAAMRFTVLVSLVVVVVNIVTGTLIAWVLVRDEFPGKRFVNALIDLPFALPTIVAGLVLLALYGPNGPAPFDIGFTRIAVALALLFVTLPFVVRSVQPVLMEADREMEEAALSLGARPRTVFARIVLPTSSRRSPPVPASPSPVRWASSARSCSSPATSRSRPRSRRSSSSGRSSPTTPPVRRL